MLLIKFWPKKSWLKKFGQIFFWANKMFGPKTLNPKKLVVRKRFGHTKLLVKKYGPKNGGL